MNLPHGGQACALRVYKPQRCVIIFVKSLDFAERPEMAKSASLDRTRTMGTETSSHLCEVAFQSCSIYDISETD